MEQFAFSREVEAFGIVYYEVESADASQNLRCCNRDASKCFEMRQTMLFACKNGLGISGTCGDRHRF